MKMYKCNKVSIIQIRKRNNQDFNVYVEKRNAAERSKGSTRKNVVI